MTKSTGATTIEINGKPIYVASTGLKIGSRGKVSGAADFFRDHLPQAAKGLRRSLRKQLDAMGRHDLARASIG